MARRPNAPDLLLRAAVWAFVGVIFGFVFVVMNELFVGIESRALRFAATTGAAGAAGSLLYSSMRLAVIVAAAAFVAIIGYLLAVPQAVSALVLLVGAGTGAVVGAIYGWNGTESGIRRADAKILAGGAAGLVASLLAILASLIVPFSYFWFAAVLCPATGLLYVSWVRWFVERFGNLLPPAGDGGLVGAGMGVLVGVLFLVMAGSLDNPLVHPFQAVVAGILDGLRPALAGAALGAFLAAAGRSFAGARWLDL